MKFNVFQLSRKGGRQNNEDRMGYCYTRDAALFVLADGMGGHADGEIAAQLALQTMAAQFQQQARPTIKKPADFLADSLLTAHHRIVRYAGDKGLPDTPRTTLVAVLVQNGHAIWVHCGDSRLYTVRNGRLLLRTRDHSYMEQGEFFAVNTKNINRNVLFTCLGSPGRPIFDVSLPMMLRQKDRIMLCSDGLWGNLSDEEILGYLTNVDRPLSEELPEMVEESLRRGGATCDNTTVIALSWDMPSVKDDSEVITDSILDGVFASTIQSASLTPEDDSMMNDDEIERSIAEINAAINRMPGDKKAS